MTEKEKMLKGKMYDPLDPELVKDRMRAKKLCRLFNQLKVEDNANKKELLKELLNTKDTPFVEPHFYCDYGYNIHVGKNFYANHNCVILDVNRVQIGDNVMFGPNVQIYTATHPLKYKERNSGRELGLPIIIEENVWIGGSAVIQPGVTIGKNSVIAAGSVVTKNIPANVLAGGIPCEIIKKIDNN